MRHSRVMVKSEIRYIPVGGALAEVMNRTFQGRPLLRPSSEVNEILAGILSRALLRYPVQIVSFVFLSNHYHGMLWAPDAKVLARFMNFIGSNIALELGRLYDWDGKFWEGRYKMSLISDEAAAQVKRLKYQLSQGVKEGLVARPEHWPGLHCAEALATGVPIRGVWYDRTREYNQGRRKPRAERQTFPEEHLLRFSKLPCWAHMPDEEYQANVQSLIDEVVEEGAAMRKRKGIVLPSPRKARRKICRVHPHSRPRAPKKSIVERFIAATRKEKERMIEAYRLFLEAYREAADELRRGNREAKFPVGCFPPGLPFVSEVSARSP